MSSGASSRAVLRASVREMLPFAGMAVVVGAAVLAFESRTFEFGRAPNTAGLWGVPALGLWGGVAIGGTSPAAALHLMVRPVGRVRLLALRVLALWLVLLPAAGVLLLAGLGFQSGGPSIGWLAAATLFSTAVGAQAGLGGHREPVALGAAALLLATYVFPLQLGIEAMGLSWSRVQRCVGAWGVVAAGVVVVAAFVPVVVAWRRWWPRRGRAIAARVFAGSVAVTGIAVVAVTVPMVRTAAMLEHAELLGVIGAGKDGVYVVVGTLHEPGQESVDGMVEIDLEGRVRVAWDRQASLGPERVASISHDWVIPGGLRAAVVQRGRSMWIPIGAQLQRPEHFDSRTREYACLWLSQRIVERNVSRETLVVPSEPWTRSRPTNVAHGRIWTVAASTGELWSVPIPVRVPEWSDP